MFYVSQKTVRTKVDKSGSIFVGFYSAGIMGEGMEEHLIILEEIVN